MLFFLKIVEARSPRILEADRFIVRTSLSSRRTACRLFGIAPYTRGGNNGEPFANLESVAAMHNDFRVAMKPRHAPAG
jgi:hypothetical protein